MDILNFRILVLSLVLLVSCEIMAHNQNDDQDTEDNDYLRVSTDNS